MSVQRALAKIAVVALTQKGATCVNVNQDTAGTTVRPTLMTAHQVSFTSVAFVIIGPSVILMYTFIYDPHMLMM